MITRSTASVAASLAGLVRLGPRLPPCATTPTSWSSWPRAGPGWCAGGPARLSAGAGARGGDRRAEPLPRGLEPREPAGERRPPRPGRGRGGRRPPAEHPTGGPGAGGDRAAGPGATDPDDLTAAERRRRGQTLKRSGWALAVVALGVLGAVVYFVAFGGEEQAPPPDPDDPDRGRPRGEPGRRRLLVGRRRPAPGPRHGGGRRAARHDGARGRPGVRRRARPRRLHRRDGGTGSWATRTPTSRWPRPTSPAWPRGRPRHRPVHVVEASTGNVRLEMRSTAPPRWSRWTAT